MRKVKYKQNFTQKSSFNIHKHTKKTTTKNYITSQVETQANYLKLPFFFINNIHLHHISNQVEKTHTHTISLYYIITNLRRKKKSSKYNQKNGIKALIFLYSSSD